MGSDVAHAVGGPGHAGIHPPVGDLSVALVAQCRDGVTLRVFDDHLQDLAEFIGPNHFTGLLDHGVARVVVGQGKDLAGLFNHFSKRLRLRHIVGERLVADHVDPGFEEGLRDREMRVVAGDDRDKIDTLIGGQCRFGRRHHFVAVIDPGRVQVEVGAGIPGDFRLRREATGHQFNPAVEVGRHPVNTANERATAAADHAHA